jgi:predicted nucleic acid-binding protein
MLLVLDSGPLGLLSNPTTRGPAREAQDWARARLDRGDHFVVPEIADYEVRRELARARKEHGLARLDELCEGLGYLPLSTAAMRSAASLWAEARNAGFPTAHDAALDGDVILAAQAQGIQANRRDETVIVATTNVSHLERYVDARLWAEI